MAPSQLGQRGQVKLGERSCSLDFTSPSSPVTPVIVPMPTCGLNRVPDILLNKGSSNVLFIYLFIFYFKLSWFKKKLTFKFILRVII